MVKKHLNIWISGLVQGVFFRKHTRDKAKEMGITGFVRNLPDGSVYMEAEGEEVALDAFMEWCQKGPDDAFVEKVRVVEHKPKNYPSFIIK